jgi:hypothetical protein
MPERTGMEPTKGRPITDAAIPSFVCQVAISTLGAILAGIVIVAIPAILLATVTRNSSGGNFADHVVEQRVFILLGEPYFVVPVVSGFALGIASRRLFRSRSAAWVWIAPTVILIWSVATWKTGGFRPYWQDVWNNYFSSRCGSSECAYEWLITAPFYTSVAYSFGWISNSLIRWLFTWPRWHRL